MLPNRFAKFCCLLFLFPVLVADSLWAQDEILEPPSKATLHKIGQLPARFNGRVMTYEGLAKNSLRLISGREELYDLQGKKQPAVRWLMDVMAGSKQHNDWPIFKIENSELLKLLKLKPRQNAKPIKYHFSQKEIAGELVAYLIDSKNPLQKPPSERTPLERAGLKLQSDARGLAALETSFLDLENIPQDLWQKVGERVLPQLQEQNLPLFVFDPNAKKWQFYFNVMLKDALAGEDDKSANPLFHQFQEMIETYKNGDGKALDRAVALYAKSLIAAKAMNSPFQMSPSPIWRETGNAAKEYLHYFHDGGSLGLQPVRLELNLGQEIYSPVAVNYFGKHQVDLVRLLNSWRIDLGLVPLPATQMNKHWKPVRIAGRTGLQIDFSTSKESDHPNKKRFRDLVIKEAGHTLVFSWSGDPEIIDKHLPDFQELMKTVKVGAMEELARWFQAEGDYPAILLQRALAVVVPDGDQVWVFALSAPPEIQEFASSEFPHPRIVAHHEKDFFAFLKTLKQNPNPKNGPRWTWQLPKGWSKTGGFGKFTLSLGEGKGNPYLMVAPLGEATSETVPALVDHWANKIGREPLSAKQRAACIREFTVADQKAFLIEITNEHEMTCQAPKQWETLEINLEEVGEYSTREIYRIPQDRGRANIDIIAWPEETQLSSGMNLYRRRMELGPLSEDQVQADAKPFPPGPHKGNLVEYHNPFNKESLLCATIPHGNKHWQFVLSGPTTILEKERQDFLKFLATVKFPKE